MGCKTQQVNHLLARLASKAAIPPKMSPKLPPGTVLRSSRTLHHSLMQHKTSSGKFSPASIFIFRTGRQCTGAMRKISSNAHAGSRATGLTMIILSCLPNLRWDQRRMEEKMPPKGMRQQRRTGLRRWGWIRGAGALNLVIQSRYYE
jgi:hypothetical protein